MLVDNKIPIVISSNLDFEGGYRGRVYIERLMCACFFCIYCRFCIRDKRNDDSLRPCSVIDIPLYMDCMGLEKNLEEF